MQIKKVAIIGAGALGTLYGDFLTRKLGKQSVCMVADAHRIEKYRRESIYANGALCDFTYADAAQKTGPADLVLFAVKYTQLNEALQTAENQIGPHTVILSLLNGITSEEQIARRFGKEKVLYCTAQGMDAVKEGNSLTYKHMGMLCFGEADGTVSEKVQSVADFFQSAGLAYEIPDNMLQRLWGKLVLNTGINQSVAVFETNYGGVQRSGPARDLMLGAMRETLQVAQAEGIRMRENELNYWLQLIDTLNPEGKPSLRQDIEAFRKTEADLFGKTVCELGQKHGIETPYNAYLYKRITEMEAAYLK